MMPYFFLIRTENKKLLHRQLTQATEVGDIKRLNTTSKPHSHNSMSRWEKKKKDESIIAAIILIKNKSKII